MSPTLKRMDKMSCLHLAFKEVTDMVNDMLESMLDGCLDHTWLTHLH